MSYELFIIRRAQKELSRLPADSYTRVRKAIYQLANNQKPTGSKKLIGREGWRIRIGHYRVIYEVDDEHKKLTILHIGHRRDIYR